MGIGFVIILHFVFIFILSLLIAVISALVTYFFTNKEKKKRKMFLATFTPFQTLYTFYILLFVGAIVVSEMKDVDLGIGDTWYAPINKTCRILMIDLPEQAHIECSGTTIISHVSHLQHLENKIIGKTYDDVYFSINLESNESQEYQSQKELEDFEEIKNITFKETKTFYRERKWEVSGTGTIIVIILSILVTFIIVFVFCRLVLHGWKLGLNSKNPTSIT